MVNLLSQMKSLLWLFILFLPGASYFLQLSFLYCLMVIIFPTLVIQTSLEIRAYNYSNSVDLHMFISNSFVHFFDVTVSNAGIMVYSQPVLGFFMLLAHVAYDEISFRNLAYVILIIFHAIVLAIKVYCS